MSFTKPTIFISHINEHEKLAGLMKKLINEVFSGAMETFVSSDEESIGLGDEWLSKININLENCNVMLLICSEQSVNRPWIAFEAGVGWAKKIKVVPVCCFGLNIKDLPMPFNRWQATNVSRVDSLNRLLKMLAKEFEMDYDESKWIGIIGKYADMIKKLENN